MNIQSESFTLVVVGRQNPAIHHPQWYEMVGAITAEEGKHAVADESFTCLPVIAQFRTPSFSITCDPDRWIISINASSYIERAKEVASSVFRKLDETPVRAFGFNSEQHFATKYANIATQITNKLAAANFGLPAFDENTQAKIHGLYKTDLGALTVRIEPSVKDSASLFIAINHHFDCLANEPGAIERFDLSDLISSRVPESIEKSKSIASNVLEAL